MPEETFLVINDGDSILEVTVTETAFREGEISGLRVA